MKPPKSLALLVSLKALSSVEAFRSSDTFFQPTPNYSNCYSHLSCRPSRLVLFAKKNKKGNKNKNKKKQKNPNSGFAWASSVTLKPYEAQSLRELASMAISSFEGRTGKPLTTTTASSSSPGGVSVISSSGNDPPKALWNAPIACVIVGQPPPPPETAETEQNVGGGNGSTTSSCLRYANLAALEMVNLKAADFERFCPISASITQFHVNTDDPITDAVVTLDLPSEMKGNKKYERGYQKKVIRRRRKRREGGDNEDENNNNNNNDDDDDDDTSIPDDDITILNAHRWALEKTIMSPKDGKFVTTTMGVAYAWEEWKVGESTICSAGGKQRILVNVEELQSQLDKQATYVRHLKEEQGLGNKDPQVMEAVEKLLKLKDQIAASS